MKKVNIGDTMEEIVSLQNQINGLQMLLANKKSLMARYFEKTGKSQVSNSECTVFVQTRTKINYNMMALQEELEEDLLKEFVDKEYKINNWDKFTEIMKKHQVTSSEIKPYIDVSRTVNEKKLNKLYEIGKIDIMDLQGCYDAKVSKSVVLKMKNVDREIPIAEKE